eukprot:gb/GECG01007214.1/.p1 GENE.gb/GECG01007214.1/~~gb/GECG01007214.1/.p1  ORF type:complete len:399 (+),score=32.47 gb/GECG01007214.1/:1-1197(+)
MCWNIRIVIVYTGSPFTRAMEPWRWLTDDSGGKEIDADETNTGQLVAGILLSIVASVAGNFGVNFQKYGFTMEARKPLEERRPYGKQWRWWLGMLLVVFGALGDFASFALAPQSIVTPVGSMTLVANLVFGRFWLKETLGKMDIAGTVLIVSGATVTVAFGSHSTPTLTLENLVKRYHQYPVWIYFGGCFLLASFYYYSLRAATRILTSHVKEAGIKFLNGVLSSDKDLNSWSDEGRDLQENIKSVKEDEAYPGEGNMLSIEVTFPSKEMSSETQATIEAENEDNKGSTFDINAVLLAISRPPPQYKKYIRLHPLSMAGLAGVMGGQNTLFAKTVAEILSTTIQGDVQLTRPLAYVFIGALIASIVLQQHFLAKGWYAFRAIIVKILYQVLNCRTAIF